MCWMRLAKGNHPWPCTYPKGKIIVANGEFVNFVER